MTKLFFALVKAYVNTFSIFSRIFSSTSDSVVSNDLKEILSNSENTKKYFEAIEAIESIQKDENTSNEKTTFKLESGREITIVP